MRVKCSPDFLSLAIRAYSRFKSPEPIPCSISEIKPRSTNRSLLISQQREILVDATRSLERARVPFADPQSRLLPYNAVGKQREKVAEGSDEFTRGKGRRGARALMPTRGEGRRPKSACVLGILEARPRLAEPGRPIDQGGAGELGGRRGEEGTSCGGESGSVPLGTRLGDAVIPITKKNKPNVVSLPRERIHRPFVRRVSRPSPRTPLSVPSILPSSALRRDRSIELNPLNFIGHERQDDVPLIARRIRPPSVRLADPLSLSLSLAPWDFPVGEACLIASVCSRGRFSRTPARSRFHLMKMRAAPFSKATARQERELCDP